MPEPSKSSTVATPTTLTTKRALAWAGSVALLAGVTCLLAGVLTDYRWLLDAGWVAAGTGTVWLLCARFSRPERMRAVHQRYLREFFPAMLGYVVLILAYGALVPRTESVAGRAVLAILPLLPIVLLIRAMVRAIRDHDELERRIDLEAIAIAAMSTAFGFFSFGLLLSAGIGWKVAPDAVAIWVLPCLFGTFGVAKLLVSRRYRNHE
ncbi:MAG TPA: hypothetical protein VN731_06700 [Rhodanobacter sp.]|nr:hypothetical protein [Rhodanobacter sp.]